VLVWFMLVATTMSKDSIKTMELQSFAAGDLAAGYKIVDTNGFDGALSYIRITSTMDKPIFISFDGIYNHEFIKAHSSVDLQAQACSSVLNKKSLFRDKTKVYVKPVGNAPKGGVLIITGFYQE